MSAPSDVAPGPILPGWVQRAAPPEGWLTLGFVIVMALTVAWSLDDAAWVLSERSWGDFYAWATLIATLIGFAGARARWPRWVAHLVGATAAALILPVMVGSVIVERGGSPGELYKATATSAVQAWIDLAVRNNPVTLQTGHHLLAIGMIAWSVGQFAGYAVFGHRRPLDAVIVVGILLIGNMLVTPSDQLGFLIIFSVAALCVLARTHAFEEETTWFRRRIGDASVVRSLYLRGGAVFIGAAVFGSLVLTASASSAPLGRFWVGFDRTLIEWSQHLQRVMPMGGDTRIAGFGFGDSAAISGVWEARDTPALTIRLPAGDTEDYYWRAVIFDRFESGAWGWTAPQSVGRRPGQQILTGFAEAATDPPVFGRREVTYQVELRAPVGDFVFSPQDPLTVDQDTRVQIIGGQAWFAGLKIGAETYTVTASVPIIGSENNGLTANRLRSAPTVYSEEMQRFYLQRPADALGPFGRGLLQEFLDEGYETPYDLADAIEERFRSSREFEYDENVQDICNVPGLSAAECFAQHKRGYCLHYATTMIMLLREAGVPARLALGYLPGERNRTTGVEEIKASNAHAWVEVYFPGFGWYPFDPTGGGRSQAPPLVSGPSVTPPPSVVPSFGPLPSLERPDDEEGPSRAPGSAGPTGPGDNGGVGTPLLIAIAVLLIAGVGALAFVAWQRGPRGEVSPDSVWRSIGRLAGRFGFGPRPQQTVYEYAGTLGDILPSSRPELQTVARAKVEVAYGRREIGGDALRTLRDAQRRLRVDLLRLAFRRAERRRRKGR